MREIKAVCCIGLGYIGLPTAVMLASKGIQVSGCDINVDVVKGLNKGKSHIQEKDMDRLFQKVIHSGAFKSYTTPQCADAFLIAVPTPFKQDKTPDMQYVISAVKSIVPLLKEGNIIILESTSPVGSTERIQEIIQQERPDLFKDKKKETLFFAYCPERVLLGNIMHELLENSRCIGGLTHTSSEVAVTLYKIFCKGDLLITDARTAEMVKLGENSFRDINIAYANEMAKICAKNNVDVHEFIELANHHPRVNILSPSIGVGGHCIPVDPWFLIDDNPKEAQLLRQSRHINDSMPYYYTEEVLKYCTSQANNIAILGLAYKPDVNDFRESPSLKMIDILSQNKTVKLSVHDPFLDDLQEEDRHIHIVYSMDIEKVIRQADIIVMATPHSMYKYLTFSDKIVIDPSRAFSSSFKKEYKRVG